MRCLAKDRHDRFESAAALRRQALAARAGGRGAGRPRERSPSARRARRAPHGRPALLRRPTPASSPCGSGSRRSAATSRTRRAGGTRSIFGHDGGDNPARRGARRRDRAAAAGALRARTARRRPGLDPVAAATDRSRFLSPLFGRAERYPATDADPEVSHRGPGGGRGAARRGAPAPSRAAARAMTSPAEMATGAHGRRRAVRRPRSHRRRAGRRARGERRARGGPTIVTGVMAETRASARAS